MNRSARSQKGFTLIELLIAITIIAILSTIAIVTFTGISKKARDDRRISELNAIRTAMEKNFTTSYPVLAVGDFENGVVPSDPLSGKTTCNGANICEYCVVAAKGAVGATCANKVSTTQPPAAAATYIICANLEGTVNGQAYYCVSNAQ